MEFLQELFGAEAITFAQFTEKTKAVGLKLADLSKGEYVGLEKFKALETERDGLNSQIKSYSKQLAEAKKAAEGNTEAQTTIQDLQEKLKESETAHAAELMRMQREAVDNELLAAAKAKNAAMVRGLLSEVDDKTDLDAYRKQREKEISELAKAEGTSFAFESGTQLKGARIGQGGDPAPLEQSTDESVKTATRIAKSVSDAVGQSNYFN